GTGVQTCALPILLSDREYGSRRTNRHAPGPVEPAPGNELFVLGRFRGFRSNSAGRRRGRDMFPATVEIPAMVHFRDFRRLTLILSLGLVARGGLVLASPAAAPDRFRVRVPKSLGREGEVKKNFGEDVSKELRKLIDELPTHRPVEKKDLNDALKQYKLKEDDLINCITARQLAAQRGFELVMCGTYAEAPGGFEVNAQFISPRENYEFRVPTFVASDPKQAAQNIFESFRNYVDLLSYTAYCMENIGSQQWEEALRRCDAALAIDPNAETALYGRGYALMQMDQDEEALNTLN